MALLVIFRGLPGSGKSTLANKLGIPVVEADDYFICKVSGEYKYDRSKIEEAHNYCFLKTVQYLSNNKDVAVANTFTRKWEYEKYIQYAHMHNHTLQIIECHGDFKNTHNVPQQSIEAMRARWEPHK